MNGILSLDFNIYNQRSDFLEITSIISKIHIFQGQNKDYSEGEDEG